MTYKKKNVTIKKEDFEQFNIYIDQVIETAKILKERNENNFKLNDFLTALEVHINILNNYRENLFEKYNLNYIINLEKIAQLYK